MIIFENDGEIDPRLFALIGVNVKESEGAIGFFGTGLKYAIACLTRWDESILIQSGLDEFRFVAKKTEIRGREFGVVMMQSKYDSQQLGFTTELGRRWEPWMVYRELWSNAQDEPHPRIYVRKDAPAAHVGLTRVIVGGPKIEEAHDKRGEFLLDAAREPLHVVDGLEIYEGPGNRIFYRGIAVQTPDKSGLFTYNITSHLYLTEDRTAGSWATDPVIARGLTHLKDKSIIEATLTAPANTLESRLDYDYAHNPGDAWRHIAEHVVAARPMAVPNSVRSKFVAKQVAVCPSCGRPMETADDGIPF